MPISGLFVPGPFHKTSFGQSHHARPWVWLVWIAVVWILTVTALRIVWETPPTPQPTDETGYFVWQWSWWVDGDVDPTNQFASHESVYFPQYFEHPDGRSVRVNKYPTGLSQAIAPVTGACYLVVSIFHLVTGTYATDGETLALLTRAGWFATALWSCAGLIACYLTARHLTNPACAALATFAAWAGTSAFANSLKFSLYAHGVGMSVLAIVAYLVIVRISPRVMARGNLIMAGMVGLLMGLAVVIRPTNALVLFPIAVHLFIRWWFAFRLRPGVALIFAIVAVLGACIPLGVEGYTRWSNYGSPFFEGYAHNGESFDWRSPHAWDVLFYLEKLNSLGLGVWSAHPLTMVALGGLLFAVLKGGLSRVLGLGMVLAFFATVYLYGSWSCWNLGFSYGARWASDLLILWTIGLAWFIYYTSQKPRRALIYLTPFIAWSMGVCWTSVAPPDDQPFAANDPVQPATVLSSMAE